MDEPPGGTVNAGQPGLRITALARTFPSMKVAPGINPWDVTRLNEWGLSAGRRKVRASRPVLAWGPGTESTSGQQGASTSWKFYEFGTSSIARRFSSEPANPGGREGRI
jgi:hypothetical protein